MTSIPVATYRIPAIVRRLFYLSDTHLEHRVRKVPLQSYTGSHATVMALLGDIGWPEEESYWNLVKKCSQMYDYVVMILGNHEYYGKYIQDYSAEVRQELYRRCIPNTYLLENETIEFNNVCLWGSTLWTRPTPEIFLRMNDSFTIKDKTMPGGRLSISTIHNAHHRAIQHLRSILHAPAVPIITQPKPYILLTHHAPLVDCNGPKYLHSKRQSAYVNQLEEMIGPPVVAWLYGHTHQNMTFYKNNTLFSTNALGYPGEAMDKPYDPRTHLVLDSESPNFIRAYQSPSECFEDGPT